MRKCDAPGLRASPANPEFYRTTYNHQTPADNWQSLQKGGCLFNYQIRGWRQQQEFPGIVGKSVWDPWKRKQVNAWSLLPFHEPQTPNNTRTPKKDRDGKLWGDHVFEYAEKKKIDGQFLERLLPGKGCLDAPHKRDAKESNLKEFLKQHNLNDLDVRAKMNITDVAIELNAARLTLRNSKVLLRDSTDSSLGSSSSSTLPYVPIVVKHIQLENLIRNQFRRWSSCFKLHKRLIVLRRGSPLIIIAPFRNFVKISMQLALQPFMIRTNKHDGLKSFSINMHWIMSNQITMNTVYNYDFVVTLEDDVSKFKECSE
jgi:hypothetical protein